MSYDLFFNSRDPGSKIEASTFAAYFRQRANYEVSDKQAIYQNKATGVYFIFDLSTDEGEEQPHLVPVCFNLNYFRPHIFGLEAELEMKQFVKQFNLLISDPQTDGMGEGEYSKEKFLSGWNTGNNFGCHAILHQSPGHNPATLPTALIESCWRWNLARESLQQEMGDDIFVPRYMFLLQNGKVLTAIVWPDGIPSAIPPADVLIIPRKSILPKNSQEDQVVATWKEAVPIIEQFPLVQGAVPYRLIKYPQVPADIIRQLRSFAPTKEKLTGISVDKIMNEELITKARAK